MASDYSMLPIGLGSYGLNSGGAYTSYNPSVNGMYGLLNSSASIFPYGPNNYIDTMMEYQKKGHENYQDIEKSQLGHANEMGKINRENATENKKHSELNRVEQSSTLGDIEKRMSEFRMKLCEGDLKGASTIYIEMRNTVMKQFADILDKQGDNNREKMADNYLDELYAKMVGPKEDGSLANILKDLENYGSNAVGTGWSSGLTTGGSEMTIDEYKYIVYGTPISGKEGKDNIEAVTRGAAITTSSLGWGAGAGAGAVIATQGVRGLIKGATWAFSGAGNPGVTFKLLPKQNLGIFLATAAVVTIGSMIYKYCNRDKK